MGLVPWLHACVGLLLRTMCTELTLVRLDEVGELESQDLLLSASAADVLPSTTSYNHLVRFLPHWLAMYR